ncbi:glycosyltransferase family protein [Shewanella frigidimarina]|uniref:glycosyltransferase family protein n=1 Tax=Shewanella frigidimarina TaxID=56812 RepID=UPI000F4DB5B1|nr:glycosyltransferase [Shewanella frigidimarina]RPA38319.1 glycosyltransferase family 1 protein [Shewanella frigidimarina]
MFNINFFKTKVLKLGFIYKLNKFIKNRYVKRKYDAIVDSYSEIKLDNNLNDLLIGKGFTSDWGKLFDLNGKHTLFVGTDIKQDKSGFVQSLSKFCNLHYFVDKNGTWGQTKKGIIWKENYKILEDILINCIAKSEHIDLIIMQSMGLYFNTSDLLKLKVKYNFLIINIGMDERLAYNLLPKSSKVHQNHGIKALNNVVDLVLTTCPEVVDWYLKESVPAIYFPLASSQEFYFPMLKENKIYDIGFIGSRYGSRIELVSFLQKNGINVKCYGPGWDDGILDISLNNQFYNECKIVLGFGGIGYSESFVNPKLRDFEVPLSGVFYLTSYSSDLEALFRNNMILYKNRYELLQLVKYYLENDIERSNNEMLNYDIAINSHTFDIRFKVLFDGLLNNTLKSNMFFYT